MKTIIFWHFDVIEIIFTLNNAPVRKDNARTSSSNFNGHQYGQGPPVAMSVKHTEGCPRIVLSLRRIIKYKNDFYHVKMPGNDSFRSYFIIDLLFEDPV
jgi:hypothetical protein